MLIKINQLLTKNKACCKNRLYNKDELTLINFYQCNLIL